MKLDFGAYIFDLDGCVYRGDALIPGASEVVTKLRSQKKKILFLTNNSTGSPLDYSRKLKVMGIDASPADVLTSSESTARYMRRLERGSVYVVGERALKEAIAAEGFKILGEMDGKAAKYVVSGLDRELNYSKLSTACSSIFKGARYYATNADPVLPYEGGYLPGAGAVVSLISKVTGRRPVIIGKPSKHMIAMALAIMGMDANRTAIVGDALDTDIKAGKRMKLFSILTLTGVTRKEDLEDRPFKPDLVLESIKDLIEYI